MQHAKANNGRVALFVVSEITASGSGVCTGGIIQVVEPWDISQTELDPIAFECWLRARPNKGLQPTAARRLSKKRAGRRG